MGKECCTGLPHEKLHSLQWGKPSCQLRPSLRCWWLPGNHICPFLQRYQGRNQNQYTLIIRSKDKNIHQSFQVNSQTTHLLLPLLPSFFSLYLFSLVLCSNFEYLLWALKLLFFFFLLHSVVQFSPIYLLLYFVSFIIRPMLMF